MKFSISVVASAFAIVLSPLLDPALTGKACSCAGIQPPCEAFAVASSVFVGSVDQISTLLLERSEGGRRWKYEQRLVRFTIQQGLKGVDTGSVEVETGMGGGDCGYAFKTGEVYLVYAYRHPERHTLVTGICDRTRPLSAGGEDLSYVRDRPKADLGNRLFGKVLYFGWNPKLRREDPAGPLPGVKVMIEGQGFHTELVTNSEGRYEVTRLAPGTYRVQALLPEDVGSNDPQDVIVAEGGCVEEELYVRLDGHLSGKITEEEGKPVPGIRIDLVRADSPGEDSRRRLVNTGSSDNEGKYVIRWVSPGDYHIGINISWAPEIDHPYPRTYYSGFSNVAQARVITVGRGSKLEGFDFVLPHKLLERIISGSVSWGDGRPATGATVSYAPLGYEGESLPGVAELDVKGNFSMRLLEGLDYWVMAEATSSDGKRLHAEPLEFSPVRLKDPIKLTVKEPGPGFEHFRALREKKSP